MPYIGIEYNLKETGMETALATAFREMIAKNTKSQTFNLVQWEASNLSDFTDDGWEAGETKGKILLHASETNNPSRAMPLELPKQGAEGLRDVIKEWDWSKESNGSVKSISPRVINTIQDYQRWLRTTSKRKKVDQEQVQEVQEQLIEQGFDPNEAQQEAVRIVGDTPSESPRKGVPVRDRTLSSRSDRPWENTQKWRDLMAEYDIGPNQAIPIDVWREAYRHWYQTTPTFKEAQRSYQETDEYKTIQQSYNRKNPVGKEAEDNPRKRYTQSEKGQTSRQASQMRVKGRTKRYQELAAPFRERGEALPEFEINQQLFFEGWYPEAMEEEPGTGFLKPLDANKFREYYYSTGRLKGGTRES